MKILFLDQFSDLGGAQQCLLDLLPAIRERGWESAVAAPGGGPLLERAAAAGAAAEEIQQAAYSSSRKPAAEWAQFARELPRLGALIARLRDQHRVNVLYVNGPRLLPAVAWGRPSLPVLFHTHSLVAQPAASKVAGIALRRLRATVAASCGFVAEPWRPYVEARRLHVVYNGVRGGAYRERRRGSEVRIGVVGRIAPEKGQAYFVEAARLLAREHAGLRYAVIGAPLFGDVQAARYCEEIRSAASGLPVEFLGWRDPAGDLFAELDLVVVPSTAAEATTRVIPEAWAAGIPVIASATGGIPEIVAEGVTGFLAAPGSAEALAARIRDVLTLPEPELRSVTAAAREAYELRFTLARYQQQITHLLGRLGQEPPEQKGGQHREEGRGGQHGCVTTPRHDRAGHDSGGRLA